MEFSEGIGIRDLTVNNNEVLVSWKWAWEDSPPYPKVIQIPGLNHHHSVRKMNLPRVKHWIHRRLLVIQ